MEGMMNQFTSCDKCGRDCDPVIELHTCRRCGRRMCEVCYGGVAEGKCRECLQGLEQKTILPAKGA